jgi:four helix bundle protein
MTPDELRARTKKFSLEVLKVARRLPNDVATREIVGQLVRSGTSVGANYRSSCRARSDKEFIAKLGVVEDEADETMFWLELLVDDGILRLRDVERLIDEADQIVRIMVASIRTARLRRADRKTAKKARQKSPIDNHQ